MAKIKALLWDIDGTLLNFYESQKNAIRACFAKHSLGKCTDEMLDDYDSINHKYWEALERGEITKQQTLLGRFTEFFRKYGLDESVIPDFNEDYQLALGDTICFTDNAMEVLAVCKKQGCLQYAVTNGTKRAQDKKLAASGMDRIFDGIFISEVTGTEKPDPAFFVPVFEEIKKTYPDISKDEIMIIGDSLTSDMTGGKNTGIVTVWFNPAEKPDTKNVSPDIEITDLREVFGILEKAEREVAVKENTDSSGFVLLSDVIPDAILDIRYYSTYNFLGERVDGYEEPVAILTKEACAALKKVSDEAVKLGYRLKIFDCYRPQCAVDHFVRWADRQRAVEMKDYFYPEVDKSTLFERGFVAKRSGHSRGSTVDLTLFDMATQKDVDMGGSFDYFGYISWAEFTEEITREQAENRKLLRKLMLSNGFKPLAEEWWHFTLVDEPYPDTYFTFPVNSSMVREKSVFAEKLKNDLEFRLRFYDAVTNASSKGRAILNEALKKAFMSTVSGLSDFAAREDLKLDEKKINDALNNLNHAVNEAVLKLFE